jgi:hypothetical protein
MRATRRGGTSTLAGLASLQPVAVPRKARCTEATTGELRRRHGVGLLAHRATAPTPLLQMSSDATTQRRCRSSTWYRHQRYAAATHYPTTRVRVTRYLERKARDGAQGERRSGQQRRQRAKGRLHEGGAATHGLHQRRARLLTPMRSKKVGGGLR